MSGSKPRRPDKTTPDRDNGAAQKNSTEKKSGRVAFDARGNAIWEWSVSTGIFKRDVDTDRLKKLEVPDLKIADDPPQKATGKAYGTSPDQRGPGFDPYKTHSIKGAAPEANDASGDPYNSAASGGSATRERGTKPKDLKRLGEWIKRQRELQKKDE